MFGYDWPRLHAALNDLPVALLLVAVIFDLLAALAGRASLRVAGFWTTIAGAVGAGVAVLSGLQAEGHLAHGEAVHALMETHEELAYVTLGIFAVLALWRIFRESRMGGAERRLALALSLGGVGLLLTTAIYGGKMVFEHAAGIPTEAMESEMHERAESHHHHAAEGEEADHDHDRPAASTADSTTGADSPAAPAGGHTHAPGTPPHKD